MSAANSLEGGDIEKAKKKKEKDESRTVGGPALACAAACTTSYDGAGMYVQGISSFPEHFPDFKQRRESGHFIELSMGLFSGICAAGIAATMAPKAMRV